MNTIPDAAVLEELGLSKSVQNGARKTELGQEDFLTLMTTQLKNQDPFKPMENGEFLGQLAQFGAVTGIENLQQAFEGLASSLSSNQAFQAASLVGHEVLVTGNTAQLVEGVPVTGAVELPNPVSSMSVGVYDQGGQLIRRMDMGDQAAGMAPFSWDGLAEDGSVAPPGNYEIRAEAIYGGANEAFDVLLARRVQSVSLPGSGVGMQLELAGLGQVDFSEIRQIR